MTLRRRLLQPLLSFFDVLWNTVPVQEGVSERELNVGVTMSGRLAIPPGSFIRVLRDTFALLVSEAHAQRARRIVQLRGLPVPLHRLGRVLSTTQLLTTSDPKRVARFRALVGSKINGTDVLRDIYTKVYFKYYTEADIEALMLSIRHLWDRRSSPQCR
jgi:hypothetical protein